MCGRYSDPSLYDAKIEFSVTRIVPSLEALGRRYNVAPTMDAMVVLDRDGERVLDQFFWTFIPPWSEDGKPGKFSAINARDDKLASSRLYGPSFKSKRCIVPAGGFYEWQGKKAPKQPFYIHRNDNRPLGFAGIWSHWQSRERNEERYSFAIVTTAANDALKPIHDRMPVILGRDDYDLWLDPRSVDTQSLQELLRPCPDEWLEAYPVSTRVNKPGNEGPECIEPVQS